MFEAKKKKKKTLWGYRFWNERNMSDEFTI